MRGNSYVLDELWKGNLNPQHYSRLEMNEEYMATVNACIDAYERLQSFLSEEQLSALSEYVEANEELSNIIEADCFRVGFSLGTMMVMEILN